MEQRWKNSNAGTPDFLSSLRRLFPTASVNSPTAKTAVGSDTLTRSDYARFDNGNPSTALPWSFSIFVPFTRRHRVPRMHTSWWQNIRYVACADLHRVKNGWLFHIVNRENEKSCQEKRFSERLIFTRFCANGKRPAFIGVESERDETEVKWR